MNPGYATQFLPTISFDLLMRRKGILLQNCYHHFKKSLFHNYYFFNPQPIASKYCECPLMCRICIHSMRNSTYTLLKLRKVCLQRECYFNNVEVEQSTVTCIVTLQSRHISLKGILCISRSRTKRRNTLARSQSNKSLQNVDIIQCSERQSWEIQM